MNGLGWCWLWLVLFGAGGWLAGWHIRQAWREAGEQLAPLEELRPMDPVPLPAPMRAVPLPTRQLVDCKRHPHIAARLRLIAAGQWQDEGLGWADETTEDKR